jgi:hypothetical protein
MRRIAETDALPRAGRMVDRMELAGLEPATSWVR